MRQERRAGEKVFVDCSGVKLRVTDGATRELTDVELFVMVLGASNLTYIEATKTQPLPDFLASHVRGTHYLPAWSRKLASMTVHRAAPVATLQPVRLWRAHGTRRVVEKPRPLHQRTGSGTVSRAHRPAMQLCAGSQQSAEVAHFSNSFEQVFTTALQVSAPPSPSERQ